MAVALITGASQGIGECIAKRLAKDGYDIAINYYPTENDRAKAVKVAEACSELGARAEIFPADVSDFTQCADMVKAVKDAFGSLDALVNNAGITKDTLLTLMSEEQYDQVIAVNQKSVFNMMKPAIKLMMKQKKGAIVNMASVAGLYGNPGQINYAASKAAIIGMTKTAAKEVGARNIRVNAVAPGLIKTPMTDVLTDEQKGKIFERIALKRFGEVEEIASVVSFLLSDSASYITGQTIEISGGLEM
ncbi:MAG: 3-oxoacyl-[acyl-carrier-protein] reductase [Ruminiclostridium sp.]|nr:3-oxoacyl-[acyl-carrier-protein] reductase [Ruminiclostridium sp.]